MQAKQHHITRFGHGKAAALLASCVLFAMLALPHSAFADVRKADLVMGESIEARGLSVAYCPDVAAEYAIVMDENGTVYFERDADTQTNIASITKIMTAVVALDSIPTGTTITVSDTAASIGESSAELQVGDTLTLSEALKALMVPSGNDAAQAIAETVGAIMLESSGQNSSNSEACVNTFVNAMNSKAAELGMTNTKFTNPHGLDDGVYASDQHSTARDVALLCRYAMGKQAIRDCVGNINSSCTVMRDNMNTTLELHSTDDLLGQYEGACGIKTGFTDLAGACFAGACNRNNEDLYAVVLKSTDESQRFRDTESLWDWVYKNVVDYPLATAKETTVDASGATVPLVAKVSCAAWTDKTVEATLANPDETVTVFGLQGNVSQNAEFKEPKGAVKAGDALGTITYMQHNEVVATAEMVATQDVPAPNFIQGIGVWWHRLLANFTGAQKQAESVFLNDAQFINDKGSGN